MGDEGVKGARMGHKLGLEGNEVLLAGQGVNGRYKRGKKIRF